jgi:hypothetical protein
MDDVRFEEELVNSLRVVIGERLNSLPIELSVG